MNQQVSCLIFHSAVYDELYDTYSSISSTACDTGPHPQSPRTVLKCTFLVPGILMVNQIAHTLSLMSFVYSSCVRQE